MTQPQIIATTVSEVIAVVDHALKFTPEEDLVAMSLATGRYARVDYPTSIEDILYAADAIGRFLDGADAPDVWLFAFTTNTTVSTSLVLGSVGAALAGTARIEAMMRVSGDQWCDFTTGEAGERGTVTAADRDRIAVQAIYAGRPQPAASRDEHTSRFTRTEVIGDATMTHVVNEVLTETSEEIITSVEAILEVARATTIMPNDTETARLVAAATLPSVREAVTHGSRRETALADLATWTHAATRTPAHQDRAGVLHLAAHHAWLAGDGPVGWTALDLAHTEGAEADETSRRVAHALTTPLDPRTWQAP